MKGNSFDLNVGRYLRTASAEAIDLATALTNYQDARARRRTSEQQLFARLAHAGIIQLGMGDE